MKKVISLVMALVMIMAISVPAFAANINNESAEKTSAVLVKTDTLLIGAGTFDVTIPAEIVIVWGQAKEAEYTVETQLAVGKQLTVTVADKATGTLVGTMAATGTADTLVYDITGDTTVVYDEVQSETEKITLTVQDWNKTIAEYTNYVTFTAEISDKA